MGSINENIVAPRDQNTFLIDAAGFIAAENDPPDTRKSRNKGNLALLVKKGLPNWHWLSVEGKCARGLLQSDAGGHRVQLNYDPETGVVRAWIPLDRSVVRKLTEQQTIEELQSIAAAARITSAKPESSGGIIAGYPWLPGSTAKDVVAFMNQDLLKLLNHPAFCW